jgi:hypothetical protein
MKLFDRLASRLDSLGRRANQALDEGKLRVDLARVRRRMDGAARSLGYLTYRQANGRAGAPAEAEGLVRRIAEAEAEVNRIEAALQEVKQRGGGKAQAEPSGAGSETEPQPAPEEAQAGP